MKMTSLLCVMAGSICISAYAERGLPVITMDSVAQQAKLASVVGVGGDFFGSSVALSSNGNTALIGARGVDVGKDWDQGAGYVFTQGGSGWSQQAKLMAADAAAEDRFGSSAALSSDGNTALIGAFYAKVGGNRDQGAGYVFTRSGTSWSQQAKLAAADGAARDYFGGPGVVLSSDGNTALIGACGTDVSGNENQGAGYVFTRSAGNWSQQVKLTAADGAEYNSFGWSVALSSDGNTALIGAPGASMGGNVGQGAGYVFTRSAGNWSQQAKLTAADGAEYDDFGALTALSSDGNTAFIGADYADVGGNEDQGAGYVFTCSGSNWSQQAKLAAADGAEFDRFSWSAALNSDGNTAIIGAWQADIGETMDQGAGYVFTRSGTSWSQQAKLAAADGVWADHFGWSTALSSDGNTAFISACAMYAANHGAGYVFTVPASSKIGPTIKANDTTNNVIINYPDPVSVTVEMNADIYAGVEVDWWVVALAHSGEWYYLNSAMQWTLFSGDLALCRPVYQGALLGLSSTPVLNEFILPRGTYDFWFAIDYPMDGILDTAGTILYDRVTVLVQ